jgi:hypothetical protein
MPLKEIMIVTTIWIVANVSVVASRTAFIGLAESEVRDTEREYAEGVLDALERSEE